MDIKSEAPCGTAPCVECGATAYTCEFPDQLAEGDIACVLKDMSPHMEGCQLDSGSWVCSSKCWDVQAGSVVDDFGTVLGIMDRHNLKVAWRRVPERSSGNPAQRLVLICTDPDDADTIVDFLESEFDLGKKIWEGSS